MIENVISRWQSRPFEYGSADCCQFAGECIESITGNNPMERFSYQGRRGALALIRSHGSLPDLIASVLGPEKVEPARDGDIVTVTSGGRDIVGFVWGGSIILRTEPGLVDWPLSKAVHAWAL